MRERLREDLRNGAEQRDRESHSTTLMDAVLAGATIEFPPMLAQHEVEHMLQELARQTGQDPEAILQAAGPSAQQLRENMRGEANERVRRSLVLERLAAAESIAVADDEVAEELTRMGGDGPQAEQVRAMFDNENGHAMLQRNLLNTRIMDRLHEIAAANAGAELGGTGESVGPTETAAEAASATEGDAPEDQASTDSDGEIAE